MSSITKPTVIEPTEAKHKRSILSAQYISLIVTIINIIDLSISSKKASTKISLTFSTTNLLNILGFFVFVWRYHNYASDSSNPTTNSRKNRRALIALGIIFIICGFLIIFDCIFSISNTILPSSGLFDILFGFLSFVAYFLLSIWHYIFSRKSKNSMGCLQAACLISAISSLSSLSSSFSMLIYISYPNYWFVDYVIGIASSLLILNYGFSLFLRAFKNRIN